MDDQGEQFGDLLGKLLSGTLTSAERAALDRWFADDPRRRVVLDALPGVGKIVAGDAELRGAGPRLVRTTPGAGVPALPSVDAPFAPSVGASGPPPILVSESARGHGASHGAHRASERQIPVVGVTTVAVMACVVGAFIWLGRPAHGAFDQPTTPPHVIATVAGQRATMKLSDGTLVTLGPDSHLEVPADFGDAARMVTLSGEALFEVVHDSTRPFVVDAGNTRTTDLGTRFGIRAYPSDTLVRVVVAAGRVSLRPVIGVSASHGHGGPLSPTVLQAGYLATVHPDGSGQVQTSVDVDDLLGWADGCLAFHQASLGTVAAEVGRWYGVDVSVAGSATGGRAVTAMGGRALTARWCSATLTDVLGAVSTILDVEYVRTEHAVVLRPRHAVAAQR